MQNRIASDRALAKARRIVQAGLADRSGVAVIEFALILPILVALYFGAVEFSNAMTVDRRVTSIASSAADLAAQVEEVNAGGVQDIFNASRSIMQPYDTDGISIVLTSVVADEDNNTTVDWSCAQNGTPHAEGSTFTLPPNLTQPFTSVIVAEVAYTYQPPIVKYVAAPINLTDVFYLRPRRSLTVEFNGAGC